MLSHRAKNLTPSMTLGISTKVKSLKKEGVNVINLSIGEPDFFTPEAAKNGGIKAINDNLTKYDAAAGNLELRKAICEKLKAENNVEYTPEQIVVSSGAKHSITNTLMAIINPGDEVIIPKPYWLSYPEMVNLTGGVPIFVDTAFENNFKLTANELLNTITPKTKALIITNPSNPTGAVYTKEELLAVATICAEKNIYIIADEIYERICFTKDTASVASLSKEIKEKTIIINGMSKSLSMTGWRIGFTASVTEIAKAMSAIQGHLVSHPSTVSQHAALAGLKGAKDDIIAMKNTYEKRCQMVTSLLDDIAGISYVKPEGAFYAFINLSALRAKGIKDENGSLSLKVCDDLLDKHQVAFIPGIGFGNDDFIRMSYATSETDIKAGLKALKTYIESL